jgi:DNA (cytosine-5)-methyltransferase 1
VGRVAHGVASRVDRLRAIGNGQVPAVAALAWRTLRGG